MAKLRDVAKLAGVGAGTVSRVLNNHPNVSEETRQRVEAAIKKLRYFPNESARSMKLQSAREVALMIPSIDNPYLSKIAHYIEDELYKHNYKLLICNNHANAQKEQTYLGMLKRNQIAGIIGITYNDIVSFLEADIPFVSIDRIFEEKIPFVAADNFAGGEMACQQLVAAGCKKIAYLGDRSTLVSEVYNRQAGFAEKARKMGIPFVEYILKDVKDIHMQTIFITSFLDLHKDVDGVFCINDLLAAALYREAKLRGIAIPEQMKIIGFDGIQDNQNLKPYLSTIVQPVADICRVSVELLQRKIENHNVSLDPVYLPVTFRKGDTT